ncbi:AAA family ATPase [Aerococcus mictus]
MTFNSIKIHNNLPLKYDELRIDFFTNNKGKYKEKRVNLIYGRNGVGKTTLSRSLKNYTDDDTEIVVFLDKNNNILDPNDVCPIHVYNEDFIKENFIFTKDSNLNAIVMTGESEEIEKEIEGHKENCSKLEDEFSKLTEENKAIRENYKSALKKLKNELRGSNSWAERDSSIRNKNSKKNSTVNEDTILKFKNLFDEIKDELYEKGNLKNNYGEIVSRKITSIDTNLSETINALNKARNEQSLIKLNLVYQIDNNIEENIDYILNKTLDRDSDTDIADDLSKNIMKTYETEGLKHIGSGFDKLKKQLETEQNYCPMCFQQINDEYIKMLQNKLNEIREKELKNNVVEKFKKEIEEYKIAKISFDNDLKLDDEFSSYFLQEQQKLKELIDEYNGIVNSINNILEDKKDKLYTSVNNELSGQISNKYRFLLEYIKEINQKIYAHNKSLADQDKLICKATMENNKYTLYT